MLGKFILALIIMLFSTNIFAMTKREAAVAGTFYPADKLELEQSISAFLENVNDSPEINGQIVALIVPHAGYVYSGQIAAHAFKLIQNSKIKNVILCGPSHHYRFSGLSVYGPNIVWQTPLGNIRCNNSISFKLINHDPKIDFIRDAHAREHSLEVQLPFLQTVLDDFKITPMAMGIQDGATINLMASALKNIDLGDSTIMIASTDLQHYRNSEEGWQLDSLAVSCIENLDPVRLDRLLNQGDVEMCGGGAVTAVMKAAIAKGANQVKILKYGHSGETYGGNEKVVGYVAAVIYKPNDKNSNKVNPQKTEEKKLPNLFELSEDEKHELLDIARRSVEQFFIDETIPDFEVSDNLKKFGAGFVTLEKNNNLRGCIGYTSAVGPLYRTIAECAIKAAVSDPRFPPVKAEELGALHIEISVLSPMQKVDSFDEIEVGRDGLMIFSGKSRGLLLPQVAIDNDWDRETFLQQTCRKAGLAEKAYKSPEAIIYKFQAVIFEEENSQE